MQFALYFLNNFVVLVTVLLAFLMELKMNWKKNKQLSRKEVFACWSIHFYQKKERARYTYMEKTEIM